MPIESKAPDPSPPAPPAGQLPHQRGESSTYADIARLMNVTKQTVYEWVRTGRIPSPVYIGATARFTPDQVSTIQLGISAKGTHEVAESIRAVIGKKGGSSKLPKKGKATNPAQARKRASTSRSPARSATRPAPPPIANGKPVKKPSRPSTPKPSTKHTKPDRTRRKGK